MRKIKPFLKGLSFLLLGSHLAYAQAPGGVPVNAWYRSDALNIFSDAGNTSTTDNQQVYQWNSEIGDFPLLQTSAVRRPVFSNATTLANFNPTVTFDGSNDWMQFTAGQGVNVIDRANGTIYAAGYMDKKKRSGFVGFHPSMDYPGLHFFSDYKLLFFTGGPGYQGVSNDAMQDQTYFSAGSGWVNGAGSSASYAAATVSLNGIRTDYSGGELYNANLSTGARDIRIGADNNYGAFSGQLNEILIFEDKLTSAQMDQVETYLAIKYGTTYAKGTRDYVNSSGATVWNAGQNAGYHYNLAGIANDGVLHQKQSWSTNTGQQVLIGTTGLDNTNADNPIGLTSGQFLIWGDNGKKKTPIIGISTINGISHRFEAIWKVQNTQALGTVRIAWPKGLTNLTLIQSDDETIDDLDIATSMIGNEIVINGITYNFADVTLSDGQYFTLGAEMAAPGGVFADLKIWLRSDEGFAPHTWMDISGNSNDYTQTHTSRQPFTASEIFNFNPVVDFGKTGTDARFMVLPTGKPYSTNFSSSTIFTTSLNRANPTYSDIIGFGATTTGNGLVQANDPVLITYGSRLRMYPSTASSSTALPPVKIGRLHLNEASLSAGVSGITYGLDGIVNRVNATLSSGSSKFASGSILGSQPEPRNGLIGEVIAYERELSENEKKRVRSYLAIKYGITLPHNYIAGDNETIYWDIDSNMGFNNNVAGLALDPKSSLHQKQSQSINDGVHVLIGTDGMANSNAENSVGLAENQFLVWGDNGLQKTPSIGISGVANVNFRFASVWKVQNTGNVGTVRVAWPAGFPGITLVRGTDSNFESFTSSYPMMANNIQVNGVVYNYADVSFQDGDYFTFAVQLNGPGGVGLDLRVWLRADAGFSPSHWTDLSGASNHFTQTNESRQPFVSETQYNFNPIIDFGGSASADGRFMVVPAGKPFTSNGLSGTFFTTTLTRSGGTSGYRDIWGFGGTTTGSGLTGADNPAITKLNNDIVLYSSTASAFPAQYKNYQLLLSDISYTVGVSGIKYGLNGDTARTNQTRVTGNSLQANGSILGSQPEVANGLIGEAIAYERDLTEEEKQRVRTYIAVKYGLTLPHNYIASNASTVFWDVDENDGYNNNIAGIARDDYGSLLQKQSNSINSGSQVLIAAGSLSNTNSSNTGLLADQQFLVWGDNDSAKAPIRPITGVADVNNRFAAIWKVQNTNDVGTVRIAWPAGYANLKLIQSTDEVINSSDIISDMNAVETVNGVEYAYADVVLENGQYFTFAAFVQAPGGVTNNLSYWYRADQFVDADGEGADVNSWTDFTSGVVSAQINDDIALPKFKEGESTYFNFNPGINFTAAAQMLGNINVQTINSLDFDLFTLTKEGMSGTRFFNIGMNNTTFTGSNWDHPGLYANGNIARRNNTGGGLSTANPGSVGFSSTSPSIMYHKFTDLNMSKGLNGAALGTASTHSARGEITGGHIFGSNANSGNNPPNGDDAGFTGHIGEVVIYGHGTITPEERNKVETYLAVKYGVTLNGSNYTTSQDVVVWDASANAGYGNNIGGIGNDFISALHQKQSRSQHSNNNGQVIIGLGEIAETNKDNPNQLNDGEFLIWGDNGNVQSMTNAANTYTTFSYGGGIDNSRRMNRVWKVQNTGVSDLLLLRYPVASVGSTTLPEGDNCSEYAIILADDADFTTNVTAIPLTITEDGLDYEANYVFPAGLSYFTFGKVTPLGVGNIYLPEVVEATTEYDDDCNTGEWTYFHKTAERDQKLIAFSGFTTADMDGFDITITPEGAVFDDGDRRTTLMARVTTIEEASLTSGANKVRLYYSQTELDEALVTGAVTTGWFWYGGNAEDVIIDIYSDGVFDVNKAIELYPDASGIEDGINYVEFHNVDSLGSFIFLSSTEALGAILPVSLSYFTAEKKGSNAMLLWATAAENNNRGFGIERSTDGKSWFEIGFVPSQSEGGHSRSLLSYSFVDNDPANTMNYYRLKQTDFEGKHEYSIIKVLDFTSRAQGSIITVPNPVKNELKVLGLSGKNQIVVANALGQVIWTVSTDNTDQYNIDMSPYTPGVYMINVIGEDGTLSKHKVIKK